MGSFAAAALSLLFLATAIAAELRGEIVSCSGWALNKLPKLKSFLKDGEAEWYYNVSVKYVGGKKAVLTIYDGDEEKEKVTLSDYKEKEEMHAMMVEKGFAKKTNEEIEQVKAEIKERKLKEDEERKRKREERLKQHEQRRLEREAKEKEGEEEKAAAEDGGRADKSSSEEL